MDGTGVLTSGILERVPVNVVRKWGDIVIGLMALGAGIVRLRILSNHNADY